MISDSRKKLIDLSQCPYNKYEKIIRDSGKYDFYEEYIPANLVERYIRPGLRLYLQTWAPKPSTIKGHAVFIHGMNDYGGRFMKYVNWFLSNGYLLSVADMPGHGRSSGTHGLVESVEEQVKIIALELYRISQPDYPGPLVGKGCEKYFLFGGSMGGLILLQTLIRCEIQRDEMAPFEWSKLKCCAAIAPLVKVHEKTRPNFAVEMLGRMIYKYFPALPVSPANRGLNHRDPKVEQEFVDDPGTYSGYLRIGTGMALLEGMVYLNQHYSAIRKPLLIMHGKDDLVTDPAASEELFSSLKTTDKKLVLVDDGDHVLWAGNNGHEEFVFMSIINWFDSHN
jgi:acylglycerol lipase